MSKHAYTAGPDVAATTLAELVDVDRVLDPAIHPLWAGTPRVLGPAYAVRCHPGDQLPLHAAIYRAAPGSVIVVESGGSPLAVAGGNVCAVAQRNGIAGFVVDGYVRDLAEVRERGFPVFARGVFPKPGGKNHAGAVGQATVGGVHIRTGDLVLADEEGIVSVPADRAHDVLAAAEAKATKEAAQTLDQWEAAHRERITAALLAVGDEEGLTPVEA